MPFGEEMEGDFNHFIVAVGEPGQKEGPEATLLVIARNSVEAASTVPSDYAVRRVSHQFRTAGTAGPSRVVGVYERIDQAETAARQAA